MVSRLPRLWQPGALQRRLFLPDFWVAPIETSNVGRERLPRNCVKFEVDIRMSRHDVREYLSKVYGLPVRDVRTEVQMGEILWHNPKDYQYKRAIWKEDDKKYAYVFMKKDFQFDFPQIFPEVDPEETELRKASQQIKEVQKNDEFANRDRLGRGEMLP